MSASPIADPPSPGPAGALFRLCELLGVPAPVARAGDLRTEHFAAWKPAIEGRAFEDAAAALALSELLVALAGAPENPEPAALAWWTRGNVFVILDRPLDALAAFERAETLYAALGAPLSAARLRVGKVATLTRLGRYAEALACGAAAAAVLAASPDLADGARLAGVYNGLGIAYEYLGRYTEALDVYEYKLRWWRDRAGERATRETARAWVNIGVVSTRLGQYAGAGEAFELARQLLAAGPVDGQALGDIARADMNLAWLEALRRSDPPVVTAAFERARGSRAQVDEERSATDLALLDLFEAEWQTAAGSPAEVSRQTVLAAEGRLAAAGQATEAARAGILLGRLAVRDGAIPAALERFASIASEAVARGDAEIAYLAGVEQARSHRAAGRSPAARRALEDVIAQVEALRAGLRHDEHRAGYLEDKLAAYRELAALCLEDDDIPAALAAIERSKARTLAELLAAGRSHGPAAGEDVTALLAEERALRERLVAGTQAGAAERRDVEQQLFAVRRRLAEQRGAAGDLGQGSRVPEWEARPERQRLPDWQALLSADTLLVAYGVLSSGVVAFQFDRDGLRGAPVDLGRLPAAQQVRVDLGRITSVARLPRAAARRWAAAGARSAQVPLAGWYDAFWRPLAIEPGRYRRLVIVPDDLLNTLPYAAFYDRETGRYLVQDYEVVVAPSLATWALLSEQATPAGRGMLAVGYSSAGRLPRAVDEARAVAALYPTAHLLEEGAATRAAVAAAARDAALVHLATHGVYRADTPAFSYLELADGPLEAFDIAGLELDAAAVVLSACETGVGHLTGNELMGLVRAFLHAGARSVVATHWPVDDEATEALLVAFAGRVAAGAPVARALQEAQADWLARHQDADTAFLAHPYYWGGLSVVGAAAAVAPAARGTDPAVVPGGGARGDGAPLPGGGVT